jgi:TonB-dependent receptor
MLKKSFSLLSVLLLSIFTTSQESEESVEEVVTVGTKASIISAIDKQRESNLIVSVVDSDALGDFPDTTAAEAIRRLSGITVENDQGEGRYVSIRGLSGDLNAIAVNGAMVPAPEGGRKVMLDGLPTELLDSIEVYKSLTADKDADSIGGRIEFKTKKARSLNGTLFKVKLDTSYNDQSKNSDNPKFAMTYGEMINDNLGHIVGLTYASKQIISYNNETGFPGWTNDGAGKRLDDDWEMRYYDLTRERTGVTYDVDFIVDDETSIFANFLYNHYQDDELRNKDEYGSLKHGEVFSDYSEINRIRRDAEVRRRIETRDIRTAVIGAETMFNGWFAEIQYSHSYAEEDDTNNIDVKFRSKRYDTDDCGGPCGYLYYSNPQKVGLSFDSSVAPIWDTYMTVDAWEEDWSLIKDTEQAKS